MFKKTGRFSSTVRVPAAQQVIDSHKKPSVTTLSNGDIRIRHREFITDLIGSESFSVVSSYPIQPGMSSSFPWLSRLAANFESYKFESLSYHVTTMSSTATRGTLGVAIDYDASDPAPTTKVQALAMQFGTRSGLAARSRAQGEPTGSQQAQRTFCSHGHDTQH